MLIGESGTKWDSFSVLYLVGNEYETRQNLVGQNCLCLNIDLFTWLILSLFFKVNVTTFIYSFYNSHIHFTNGWKVPRRDHPTLLVRRCDMLSQLPGMGNSGAEKVQRFLEQKGSPVSEQLLRLSCTFSREFEKIVIRFCRGTVTNKIFKVTKMDGTG